MALSRDMRYDESTIGSVFMLLLYFFYRLLAFKEGFPSPCFSIMDTPGGMGWTHSIASSLGASESGLRSAHYVYPGLLVNILINSRLVLGQLAGYPLLLLYRRHLANKDTNTQHLYFFLSGKRRVHAILDLTHFLGLLLAYWVIGDGVTHSLYTILLTYVTLLCLGGSIAAVSVTFVFNMFYLLAGYW